MKKREKHAQRKQKIREKKRTRQSPLPQGKRAYLRAAAHWPLHECLMTKDWQNTRNIIQVLVARRSLLGEVICGVFLVDLGCLGVKNAFPSKAFGSVGEYRSNLRRSTTERQEMVPTDLNLAARVIREAVTYARSLGFAPNRDYPDAAILLGDADPDACDVPIPLGNGEGKPLFIAGPYDNSRRTIAQLIRAVGVGNFEYLVPLEDVVEGEDEDWLPI